MNDLNRNLVLLGALLHDIGKVYQRTGLSPVEGYEQFSKEDLGSSGLHEKQRQWLVKCLLRGTPLPEEALTSFKIKGVAGQPDYQVYWMVQEEPSREADAAYLINATDCFEHAGIFRCGFKYIANYLSRYEDQAEVDRRNEKEKKQETGIQVVRGMPKDFDDFAEASAGGFLGVLRMDVDYLGAIFSFGIAPDQRSISRTAALSTDIELFFTGYLNTLCGRPPRDDERILAGDTRKSKISHRYQNIYVTYAGGDDVFIVGAWDEILDLAIEIYQEFKAFTCENPDIHISGGIYICKPRYPIHRAAYGAALLLNEVAKENSSGEAYLNGFEDRNGQYHKRNALALFNHRITWKDLLEGKNGLKGGLKGFGDYLIKAIQRKDGQGINRTYLYKLLELWEGWQEQGVIHRARFHYITIRNVKDKMIRERLIQNISRYLDKDLKLIPILVSYVGLKTRKKKEDE